MRKSISIDGALVSKYTVFAKKFGVTVPELVDHSLTQHYRAALEPRKHATRIILKNGNGKAKATKSKPKPKAKKVKRTAKPKLRAVA